MNCKVLYAVEFGMVAQGAHQLWCAIAQPGGNRRGGECQGESFTIERSYLRGSWNGGKVTINDALQAHESRGPLVNAIHGVSLLAEDAPRRSGVTHVTFAAPEAAVATSLS